MQVDTRLNAF